MLVALSDLVGQIFMAHFKPLQSQAQLGILGKLVSRRPGGDKETLVCLRVAAESVLLDTVFPWITLLNHPRVPCLLPGTSLLPDLEDRTVLPLKNSL